MIVNSTRDEMTTVCPQVRILNERVKTPTTTVYRCGPLIDLCRGPHVRHTGKGNAPVVVLIQELPLT